jgi:hypothetical protein
MIWTGLRRFTRNGREFLSADLATAGCALLAARFPTVGSLHLLPDAGEKIVAGWAAQTPSPYKLTLRRLDGSRTTAG